MGTIYAITNKVTLAVYIGSSMQKDVRSRWRNHRGCLQRGAHQNIYLQRAWDKYGKDAFEFTVIESVEDDGQVLERGQFWLDKRRGEFPADKNYNLCWVAGSCKGLEYTPERNKKVSDALKGRKLSDTQRKVLLEGWEKKREPVSVLAPDGTKHVVRSIRQFCVKHGLEPTGFALMMRGGTKQHMGWSREDSPFTPRDFAFISPEGVAFENILRLDQFCAEHGLDYKQMSALHKGGRGRKSAKGWKKYVPEEP